MSTPDDENLKTTRWAYQAIRELLAITGPDVETRAARASVDKLLETVYTRIADRFALLAKLASRGKRPVSRDDD